MTLAALTVNIITTPTAVAAVLTPWWLPVLQTISEAAALALPILGVLWLTMQIGAWLWNKWP